MSTSPCPERHHVAKLRGHGVSVATAFGVHLLESEDSTGKILSDICQKRLIGRFDL